MTFSAADSAIAHHHTVGEFAELDQDLALICDACDFEASYQVGRVVVDRDLMTDPGKFEESIEDAVSFSGLFRCRKCDSGGPWRLPKETRTKLLAVTTLSMLVPEGAPIQFGKMSTFDGTPMRTGAQSEDYLKQKLAEHPDDAFLWGRLGNLYDHNDQHQLARAAYEKAVELDPNEIESNYSLGCYHMDDQDEATAAMYFQRIARAARSASRWNPTILRQIVRESLERLFSLHQNSPGTTPFPPEFEEVPSDWSVAPNIVDPGRLDLSSDDDWEVLTSICLEGKAPPRGQERAASRKNRSRVDKRPEDKPVNSPMLTSNRRVGRNEPCPCGSGKKYKRCCGSVRR